ncbi:MAG: toxin-antitoxin system HicB family antitoxin [Actinoplanes sp.]
MLPQRAMTSHADATASGAAVPLTCRLPTHPTGRVLSQDILTRDQVRVPEEVHRRLALRAAEQGVSLNALASSRLAGA